MQAPDTPLPATGLIRLTAAARIVGVTPETMRAALNRQDIPIARIQLGNVCFVRAAELNQWLTAPTPATADLFSA